jgi:hypothetical protein
LPLSNTAKIASAAMACLTMGRTDMLRFLLRKVSRAHRVFSPGGCFL